MSEPVEPLFEAKGISKYYPLQNEQSLHVLEKIDLSLYPNEVVAVIGPSGCGKSTLLRILAGLIPQSEGQIFYRGKELQGLMPRMSMVFQTFALYPWLTVRENIEIVLKSERASTQDMEKMAKEAIHLINLHGFEEAYPREISGGMKQRVGMARALVKRPEMLFMDEPFSELDAFTAESLRAEVIKLWARKEVGLSSILLISHDVHEVAYMADRIIVLGMHPTVVRAVIRNDIPRPRDYRSPEFLKLVETLHDTYGRIKAPHAKPQPKGEKIAPLLHAGIEEILGLLEVLHRRGGSQDIFKIGAASFKSFDRVAIVIEAAELLGFVEIIYRNVGITAQGNEFLSADNEGRHALWKKQLLTIPLFIQIVQSLKKAPGQSLSHEALIDFLKREIPHQDASGQLHILLRWGQFANLFTYHKISKTLHLT